MKFTFNEFVENLDFLWEFAKEDEVEKQRKRL